MGRSELPNRTPIDVSIHQAGRGRWQRNAGWAQRNIGVDQGSANFAIAVRIARDQTFERFP